VAGLVFYIASGLLAVYAALTGQGLANRGFAAIESLLLLLLLFETLVFRLTKHLPTELPTMGDVIAGCVRWAVRLWIWLPSAARSQSVRWARWLPKSGRRTIARPRSQHYRRSPSMSAGGS